jgi:hypothetical protein
MSKNKLRNRQTAYLSTRMRIVIGASIFAAASLLLIVVFNISDVKESRAFSSGDYRTITSGDWSDNNTWEVYDGENWSSAAMPPGPGVKTIVVSAGNELAVTEEVSLSELIIEEGGNVRLDANSLRLMKTDAKGGILCKGKLDMGTAIIEGDGDFIVEAGATLFIGSDSGIDKKGASGNVQLRGKRVFSKDASYIFNGTIQQHSGNGLPTVLRYLVIQNTSGVELDQSFFVIDTLALRNGILKTGKYVVTVGSSTTAPGYVESFKGAVSGKLKRWYGPSNFKEVVFPVTDTKAVNIFSFTSDVPEFQKGMIELNYHEGSLSNVSSNPFDARQVVVGITEQGYYTALLSNGPEEAWLKITSAVAGADRLNKISWKISKSARSKQNTDESVKLASNENIQNIVFGPNPFKDTFFVRFHSDASSLAFVQLMNAGGQLVYNEQMNVYEGSNQFQYKAKSALPPGVYMLRISNTSEIHTMKVIKED